MRIDVSHTIPTIIIITRIISIISVLSVVREFFRVSLGIAGLIVSHTLGRHALPQLDGLLVLMSWIVETLRIGDLQRFLRFHRVNVLAVLVLIVFYVVRNDLLRFLRFLLTLNSTGIHQATGSNLQYANTQIYILFVERGGARLWNGRRIIALLPILLAYYQYYRAKGHEQIPIIW